MQYYILDENHKPRPASMFTWAQWFETPARIVKQQYVGKNKEYYISTVFVGGGGCFFETTIFDRRAHKRSVIYSARHDTWEEAEAEHAHITAYINACGRPPGEETYDSKNL